MIAQAWLFAEHSWHEALLSSRTLGIAIWIGVAILTIALLVLMRTRWGQVQPLSKCVVLSIFAHALLFLFAYGTHLLEVNPVPGGDDAIRLAFVTTDRPPSEGEADTEPEPWEQLAGREAMEPQTSDAERSAVESGSVTRVSHIGPWHAGGDVLPNEDLPVNEPERPAAKAPVPAPVAPTRSQVNAAAVEQVHSPRRSETARIIPEPTGPERVQTAPAMHRVPERRTEMHLPTELVAMDSRMQQLVDAEARSETADALSAATDQLAQSENRGASSFDSSGAIHDRRRDSGNDIGSMVALPTDNRVLPGVAASAPLLVQHVVARAARRLGDGQPMPEPYRLRSMPRREMIALKLGSSTKSAAAVEAALAWLAAEQEPGGNWDPSRWGSGVEHKVAGHDREGAGTNADTGITGLAVLAFLANGQTHLEGKYRKNVQRGLEYLLRSQSADGCLAGSARLYASMYCHGMASLALSEALAVTGDVRIEPYVQKAVDYTVGSQHSTSGGWRYQPGDQGDMSQFGWQVMALKSASLAGIKTPHKTREGMLHFLQRCEKGRYGGLSGYRPGTPATRSMSAEALVCRYFLDLAPSQELAAEASDFLLGELPQSGAPNLYYWYYGTLALFQVQGPAWTQWNEAMQRQVIRLQRTDGHLAGSWDPDTVWGAYGGRVYSTAMATLCLEVYYRYLPLTAQ